MKRLMKTGGPTGQEITFYTFLFHRDDCVSEGER